MLGPAMPDGQGRPTLDRAIQQAANLPLACLAALQIEAFEETGTMDGNSDVAMCDASGGAITLTLPSGANVIVGKPYVVKEWEGTNDVTIDAAGAGTIDGSANLVLQAGEAVTMVAREVGTTAALLVTWEVISQTAPNPAAGGELLAANNLSDLALASTARTNLGVPATAAVLLKADNLSGIASAATARSNIGANRKTIMFTRVDLVGATAAVYRYQNVSGNSETIVKIGSAINGALTTGNATLTASIGGVPVTSGVVTITQAGSAAGDKDSATPSAANVIADGASLEITVGGTNDAAVFADVSIELSY
jgi:hypothetical protein